MSTGHYRVMLGKGSIYAEQCFTEGFIGADFDIAEDLSGRLPEEWREFNREFIPGWLEAHEGKTKVSAGLACGALWTVSKGIATGSTVLCPDGTGRYRVGEVAGDYFYVPGGDLPHRRPVTWLSQTIDRADMSEALRNSAGSIGTVVSLGRAGYSDEIESLIGRRTSPTLVSTDETVEDPAVFALEKHLEDFLVKNWAQMELAKEYDIFEEDGEKVGQQYPTDTGAIDILAVKRDASELLVIELKKGRASDTVVGQVLRYMGFVSDELAEEGQSTRGVIIALEDDPKLKRALSVVPSISFYRYEVTFKLVSG